MCLRGTLELLAGHLDFRRGPRERGRALERGRPGLDWRGHPLESFLRERDVLVGIAGRHGPEVLVEVVEAVEARLARR